jgi:hypothetical protein
MGRRSRIVICSAVVLATVWFGWWFIQRADPRLSGESLADYLQGYANRPDQLAAEQGKVFLLLRVMFELPENAPPQQRLAFAGWTRGRSGLNEDGTVNLAWPVSWKQGQPRLVAGREGSAGSGYSVREDFAYLRYHFRYRDLSGP